MKVVPPPLERFLGVSEVVDWQHLDILQQARLLALGCETQMAISQACFEWVRDEICHSVDYQMNPVTWQASEVLHHRTGYCYAKSHLLAALLRANGIAAGFCYQRLSINDEGAPYCLHGLNAVHLDHLGWYRIDPRGNKPGIDAQFTPPQERLAFQPHLPQELDMTEILPEPLAIVIDALQTHDTWDEMLKHLPDVEALTFSSNFAPAKDH